MFHICSKSCAITFESVMNQGPPCVRPVEGPKSSSYMQMTDPI